VNALERLRNDPHIKRLESALASRQPVEVLGSAARKASVAVLIRPGSPGPEIFFIQRALYEGDPWSGQIAFPGGREEERDASRLATAIRETWEETGIDLASSAVLLGALDDLHPRTVKLPAVVVRPFVFLVPDPPAPVLSSECADSFWVPLSILLDRSVWRDTTVVAGGMEMSRFAFHHEGFVIWGMTERILSGLLALV
jgi:8-oxo-dGTP pyrophosphatase MutT (NUDIX family)